MKKRKLSGMTLIEILISIMIMTIAVITIMTGIYQISRFNKLARDRLTANRIAQAKLEEIKNTAYAGIAGSGPENNSLPQGTTTVQVTVVDEGKVVTVTVDWDKPGAGPAEELVTLIREP